MATAASPCHPWTVTRITVNGIVITGTEIIARRQSVKASADFWQQTWWCMVPTVALAAELADSYEELMEPPGF